MNEKTRQIKRRNILTIIPAEWIENICKARGLDGGRYTNADFLRRAMLDKWDDDIEAAVMKAVWEMIK